MKFYFTAKNRASEEIENKEFEIAAFDDESVIITITKGADMNEIQENSYALLNIKQFSDSIAPTWLDQIDGLYKFLKSTTTQFDKGSCKIELSGKSILDVNDLIGVNVQYTCLRDPDLTDNTSKGKIIRQSFILEFLK